MNVATAELQSFFQQSYNKNNAKGMSLGILISAAFSSTLRIYKPLELLWDAKYRN